MSNCRQEPSIGRLMLEEYRLNRQARREPSAPPAYDQIYGPQAYSQPSFAQPRSDSQHTSAQQHNAPASNAQRTHGQPSTPGPTRNQPADINGGFNEIFHDIKDFLCGPVSDFFYGTYQRTAAELETLGWLLYTNSVLCGMALLMVLLVLLSMAVKDATVILAVITAVYVVFIILKPFARAWSSSNPVAWYYARQGLHWTLGLLVAMVVIEILIVIMADEILEAAGFSGFKDYVWLKVKSSPYHFFGLQNVR